MRRARLGRDALLRHDLRQHLVSARCQAAQLATGRIRILSTLSAECLATGFRRLLLRAAPVPVHSDYSHRRVTGRASARRRPRH